MGSNQFRVDMPRFVDFYLSGRLKLDELVSARIGLSGINEAFDVLRHRLVRQQPVLHLGR